MKMITFLPVFLALLAGCATTQGPPFFPLQFEARDLTPKGEIALEKGISFDDAEIRSWNSATHSSKPAGLILTVPQEEDEGAWVLLDVGEVFEEALRKWGNLDRLTMVVNFGKTTLNTLGLRLFPPAYDRADFMEMTHMRGNFVKVLNLGKDFPNGGSLVIPLKIFFGPGVGWSLQRDQVPYYLMFNATKKAFGVGSPDITGWRQRASLAAHSRWFEVERFSLNHTGEQILITKIYVIKL